MFARLNLTRVLCLFCLALPAVLRGQDTDVTALSLEELLHVEVQTMSLHEQSISSAPAAISVITAKQIDDYGFRTIGEVLNHVRGFYLTYDRTYYSLGVAGLSVPGDWGTRFLTLLNGHPLPDNIFGSANYFGEDFILDLSLVDRIEVVRGPSSALYGSNGILATINVITRRPDSSNQTSVRLETDSLGSRKATLTQSVHLPGKRSLMFSGTVLNDAGVQDLYVPAFDNPATNNGHALHMDGQKGYRYFAAYSAGNWQLVAAGVSRQKNQLLSWAPTVFNDRGTRVTDQRSFVDALYTREFDSRHVLRWRISYDDYHFRGNYRYPMDGGGIDTNRELDDGHWLTSQLTWRMPRFGGDLTSGMEIKTDLSALQSVADILPEYRQNLYVNRRDLYGAAFFQQEWNLGHRWSLDLGLRYDHSRYRPASISPRAALIFEPDRRTTLKFLYGRGFRNPNSNELFFDDGKQSIGNLSLKPELADNFEVAAYRKLRGSWLLSVSGYYLNDRQIIVPVYTAAGLTQFVNAEKFQGLGGGLEVTGNAGPLDLSGSFQKQRARMASGTPANSPATLAKFQAGTALHSRSLYLSGGIISQGSRTTLAGAVLPAVTLCEATLVARGFSGAELRFGVRNIMDTRYFDPVGLDSSVDVLPQAGRAVFLTVVFRRSESGAAASSRPSVRPGTASPQVSPKSADR